MADLLVTVPKPLWIDWIMEGDSAGESPTGHEWGFFLGGGRPPIEPGERLYILAWGRIRGYAPVTRVVQTDRGWCICREGGAVACRVPGPVIVGFRGWRTCWWRRADEQPYPNWMTDGVDLSRFSRTDQEDLAIAISLSERELPMEKQDG